MKYRKLGSSGLEVSEISHGSWLTFAGGVEFEQVRACTDAAGIELTPGTLAAIDQALGDAPVTEPTPAPFARPGVLHR